MTLSDVISKPVSPEFDQLFREHYQLVYRTAYGVTGNAEDAEDVLQTIFLRLLRREFPHDLKTNPKGYLYRAAVNVSLNTIRMRRRHVLTGDAERFETVQNTGESESLEDLHRRLYEAIAELDPEGGQKLFKSSSSSDSDSNPVKLGGVTHRRSRGEAVRELIWSDRLPYFVDHRIQRSAGLATSQQVTEG